MILTTICYIIKDSKTLMLYRNKKKDDVNEGKWVGIGGKFEQGETPEECIIREVKEESGLTLINPRLRGMITYPNFYKNQDEMMFLFTATDFEGEICECNEGDLKWISNNEILNLNLWEGDKLFFKWLEQEGFFSAKMIYENGILNSHDVIFYKK